MSDIFLSASWQKLIMANYDIDPQILAPYVPGHTELDIWQGKCFVSLVGFLFDDTRVLGIPIPWHTRFEEVNLRFYVRYKDSDGWKRGVVFISEIVPKPAITWVANTLYGEHYEAMSMKHDWQITEDQQRIAYHWRKGGDWYELWVQADTKGEELKAGSEEEFITEHYWGYTQRGNGRTTAYGVEHPRWPTYQIQNFGIKADFAKLYGAEFAHIDPMKPDSVLLAEGSEVIVRKGFSL